MILFACDLDNTLIHSYRHKESDDICIEHYQGREQSFINANVVELLKAVCKAVKFVPVTTRSIEQYRRIRWINGTEPEYAVTTNGANLIHDSEIDPQWQLESASYIQPYEGELQQQRDKLNQHKAFSICRIVDGSFLFLKCRDDVDATTLVGELKSNTTLTVEQTGRKIYLLPPPINKGKALNRLKKKFSPILTVSAGDSEMDLPMLKLSDISYKVGKDRENNS